MARYQFRRGRPTWGSMARAAGLTWRRTGGKRRRTSIGQSRYKKGKYNKLDSLVKAMVHRRGKSRTIKRGDFAATKSYVNMRPNSKKNRFAMKVIDAITTKNRLRCTGAIRVESAQNLQKVGWQKWFHGDATANNGLGLPQWFDFAGVTGQEYQFWVDYTHMRSRFINQSTSIAYVTVYDLIAREDIPATNNNAFPDYCWQQGLLEQSSSLDLTNEVIGTTPFLSKRFTSFYKVTRSKKYTLNPGQVASHSIFVKENWKVTRNRLMSTTVAVSNIRQRTRAFMYVVHGAPCNSEINKSEVGVAPVAIDVQWDFEVGVRWTADNSTNTRFFPNTDNPLVVMTNPQVLDDDSGVGVSAHTV